MQYLWSKVGLERIGTEIRRGRSEGISDYDVSEADYMEDGADYLEEYQCNPCEDCAKKTCSDFCMKYDEWFWGKK